MGHSGTPAGSAAKAACRGDQDSPEAAEAAEPARPAARQCCLQSTSGCPTVGRSGRPSCRTLMFPRKRRQCCIPRRRSRGNVSAGLDRRQLCGDIGLSLLALREMGDGAPGGGVTDMWHQTPGVGGSEPCPTGRQPGTHEHRVMALGRAGRLRREGGSRAPSEGSPPRPSSVTPTAAHPDVEMRGSERCRPDVPATRVLSSCPRSIRATISRSPGTGASRPGTCDVRTYGAPRAARRSSRVIDPIYVGPGAG